MRQNSVEVQFPLFGKYMARSLSASGETLDPEALVQEWLEE